MGAIFTFLVNRYRYTILQIRGKSILIHDTLEQERNQDFAKGGLENEKKFDVILMTYFK